jgi:hypothetical protein
VILAIAGVLIVGAAAVFGVTRIGEEEAPEVANPPANGSQSAEDAARAERRAPPVKPGDVTVSVLNGTTVPGLARQVGDRVESQGFQLGNVTNDSNQQRQESVVLYKIGHEREARAVGRRLSISQRERIDPATQALAGDATVVVVTGADLSQ